MINRKEEQGGTKIQFNSIKNMIIAVSPEPKAGSVIVAQARHVFAVAKLLLLKFRSRLSKAFCRAGKKTKQTKKNDDNNKKQKVVISFIKESGARGAVGENKRMLFKRNY